MGSSYAKKKNATHGELDTSNIKKGTRRDKKSGKQKIEKAT